MEKNACNLKETRVTGKAGGVTEMISWEVFLKPCMMSWVNRPLSSSQNLTEKVSTFFAVPYLSFLFDICRLVIP